MSYRNTSSFQGAPGNDVPRGAVKKTAMKSSSFAWLAVVALLGMSACGTSTSDRALSGAGIGAGVGVVGGALVGARFKVP